MNITHFQWKLIFQPPIWQGLCEFNGGYMYQNPRHLQLIELHLNLLQTSEAGRPMRFIDVETKQVRHHPTHRIHVWYIY